MERVLKLRLDNWVPIDITSDVQFFFKRAAGDDILGILNPLMIDDQWAFSSCGRKKQATINS